MTLVYGALALLSVFLLLGYLLWAKNRERHFLWLFACVAAVNSGYFLLSVSVSLPMARFANGLAYFGAAYSVLMMVLAIMDVCRIPRRKWVIFSLLGMGTVAFLLAAGADWLGLYYRSLDIITVNGMTLLVKEYGPLHIVYTVYLLTCILLMVGMILYSMIKKTLTSGKYAAFLLVTVLLNIGVWAVEQAITETFELLSVSYIVSEVMLLVIYSLLRDYGIVRPGEGIVSVQEVRQLHGMQTGGLPSGMEDLLGDFAAKVKTLSPAEYRILQYYIQGYETADIPELAYISIHTVKKHNRSIYQKLSVASRDDLMLYIELFRCCDRLEELSSSAVCDRSVTETAAE